MRPLLLLLVACAGTEVDSETDTGDPVVVDPCTETPELAEWTRALVDVDGQTLHDFRAGVNDPLLHAFAGTLVAYDATCPAAFAIEETGGSVLSVELCVDEGPQLDALPADGREVSGWLEVLGSQRGEFRLVLADDQGPLLLHRVDGSEEAAAEPWRVTSGDDLLVCSDGEAFQSLVFADAQASTVVDSGSEAEVEAGGFAWSLRTHIAARGPRHLFDWAGAIYTIQRR